MSKSQTITTERPVQLQVNLAGAWKTVLRFDAGNDIVAERVQMGAAMLYEAAPDTKWRIATSDSLPLVLRYLGANTDGIWMDRGKV